MEPKDIGRIVFAGTPAVSPDGSTVAFVVSRVDLDANRYRSSVWLAAADGSSPAYQFTSGQWGDGDPTWSPDGRRLAFTSKRGEGDGPGDPGGRRASLHVAPVAVPGEVVTLAERAEGFASLAWSPDGSRLSFVSRVPAGDDTDDRSRPARRIDHLFSRLDGEGWICDRPAQVFTVPVDGSSAPHQLTDGPYDHSGARWSPDGSELAFVSTRRADWDLGQVDDVFVMAVDGSVEDAEKVTATDLSIATFAWLPAVPGESDRFAVVALVEPEVEPGNARMLVVARSGGTRLDLTEGLDRNAAPHACLRPPVWDNGRVLFAVEDGGFIRVMAAPVDGASAPQQVVPGDRSVTGYHSCGGTVAYTVSTPDRLPELHVADPAAPGGERRLSFVTDGFHASFPAHRTERFSVAGPDGSGQIDAWAVLPEGFDPADATTDLPMLLSIHGGPFTQYQEGWFDEFQLWASAGFVVVFANPRGSSGQSQQWGRAIRSPLAPEAPGSGWGGVDADDLHAVTDAALERWPGIDRNRVGVLGGSYGGYMTSWLIGTSDRFAAACSERAVNNILTLETASDAAGFFRFIMGVSHLDHPEEYLARSPISHVKDISTPVLILHSEQDLRCPIEQADQLFVALRLLGREVEYHRFPGEGHELSRSGSPKHRVQRAELILDWFSRHLLAGAEDGPPGDRT